MRKAAGRASRGDDGTMRGFGRAALAVVAACMLALVLAVAGCAPSASEQASSQAEQQEASEADVAEDVAAEADALRIGSLKGPTSVGLASMMTAGQGVFTVAVTADEIAPKLLQDELDIALVPANLAATLYQRTSGGITVLDVNTLGVLYAVSASDFDSVEGLRGRTVYMTGKGSVPEYTLRALLEASGMQWDDVDVQFRSEPAEVAALIAQDPQSAGMLPQPFATAATMKNPELQQRVDLTRAWEEATGGDRGSLITGVTIAKTDTVESKRAAIDEFVTRHSTSTDIARSDPARIAPEVVSLGIIDSEQVAEASIPRCNVVCLTGEQMKDALSGYLGILYQQDPASIGGALPGMAFYLM